MQNIEGSVEETSRRLFDVTGQPQKQGNAESYTLEELGIDSSDLTYGAFYEHFWRYVSLRLDAAYVRAEADGRAPRDFYIGVDEVVFRGQGYGYMVLPRGTSYDASLEAFLVGARGQFTPVTLNPQGAVQLVPWLHLGVFSWAGQFEVNAGPAQGLISYENPPRTYVVGGHAKGDSLLFAPEIGLGGEVRFRIAGTREAPVDLTLQGSYGLLTFEGSTDELAISSRNEKDLDVDYACAEVRVLLEAPLSSRLDFVAGAQYRTMSADATAQAKERSLEDTLARREKFDKHIDLDLTFIDVLFGLRW
jgi:hypothetical protein